MWQPMQHPPFPFSPQLWGVFTIRQAKLLSHSPQHSDYFKQQANNLARPEFPKYFGKQKWEQRVSFLLVKSNLIPELSEAQENEAKKGGMESDQFQIFYSLNSENPETSSSPCFSMVQSSNKLLHTIILFKLAWVKMCQL